MSKYVRKWNLKDFSKNYICIHSINNIQKGRDIMKYLFINIVSDDSQAWRLLTFGMEIGYVWNQHEEICVNDLQVYSLPLQFFPTLRLLFLLSFPLISVSISLELDGLFHKYNLSKNGAPSQPLWYHFASAESWGKHQRLLSPARGRNRKSVLPHKDTSHESTHVALVEPASCGMRGHPWTVQGLTGHLWPYGWAWRA